MTFSRRLPLPLVTAVLAGPGFGMPFQAPTLSPPMRLLQAGGRPLTAPAPGYSSPALLDVDEDGRSDLVLGTFEQGAFVMHRSLGHGRFARARAFGPAGDGAIVPGVW